MFLLSFKNQMFNAIQRLCRTHLAHHPTCYRYDHHLIRIFQFDLCLGCYSSMIGSLMGIFVYHQAQLETDIHLLLMIALMLIPTVIQPFFQRKWFKILSRTLLGFACSIYLLNVWYLPSRDLSEVLVRIGYLAVMWLTAKVLVKWRNDQTPDPCDSCPHGQYPVCYHELQFETAEEQIDLLEELNQLQAIDIPHHCQKHSQNHCQRGCCGLN